MDKLEVDRGIRATRYKVRILIREKIIICADDMCWKEKEKGNREDEQR